LGGTIPHADPAPARATRKATSTSSVAPPTRASAPQDTSRPTGSKAFDWDRLEVAVRALVDQQSHLRDELASIRADLAEREHRIRRLEAQIIEANQSRQDTGKRIDELISQLDQLDAQLATLEPE
jgi:chromosome segregation ATPase